MSILRIQLLGEFRLTYTAEQLILIDQPRQRALLAYLLLHRHTPQARRQIAFLFWPDTNEAQAHTNLRQLLHHLRRAWPAAGDFLQIDTHTLQWKPGTVYELDVERFEQSVACAEQARPTGQAEMARAALADAVDCYHGDLLPACYDEWLLTERERLRQSFLDATEQLVLLYEDQRDYATAIHHAQRLLRADPLHETTYRRLMRLYALNHDRAGALRTYHICTATLARELGVEPHQETQEAYTRLLKVETSLVLQPRPTTLSTGGERLIGRQVAWAKLQVAWQIAIRGRTQVVCINGEAGIGKTRLAEELLTWAHYQGIAQARTRSYAAEGSLAYAPVTDWLRAEVFQLARKQLADVWLSEVARLLPEVLVERPTLAHPEPLTERWQRQRFFEALVRLVLTAPQPLLLVIDDLQWCDQETLAWLSYLCRYDPKARLLLVGTMRPEEITEQHPLVALLHHLRGTGQITEIELEPFTPEETTALAGQVAARSIDAVNTQRLYHETEGNPLFIVETIRAALNRQEENKNSPFFLSSGLLVSPSSLPPTIYRVIQQRLAQLSPLARELATLAATIGRSFAFDLLTQASDRTEDEIVRGVDELWQRRIIREQGATAYDFSHDRIREVAYNASSSIRRRLLHKQVAQALVALHASNIDSISSQLGFHYEQASHLEAAVHAYRRAADVAEALYGFDSVIFYLQKMVTLLQELPPTADSVQQQIKGWLKIAEVLIITKGWASLERKNALDRAYALVHNVNDDYLRFDVLGGLRGYYGNIGDWNIAFHLAQELLALAEKIEDTSRLVRAYNGLGNAYLHRGEFLSSIGCFQQVIQIKKKLDTTIQHDVIGNIRLAEVLWLLGYPTQAQQVATEVLGQVDEKKHPFGRIHVREFMWYIYQRLGDETTMQQLARELSELCDRYGLPDYAYPAKFFGGLEMVKGGIFATGLQQMADALEGLRQIGNRFNRTYFLSLFAQAQAQSGAIQAALQSLERAQQIAIDSHDFLWQAELARQTGELYTRLKYDPREVEDHFLTAITIARQQAAKSLELRAAMSLARLWQMQGRQTEARTLLAEIYSWFTEGFDTADLQEAQVLLTELGHNT